MRSQLYWIDWPMVGRLAIMARPRADDWLDDEITGWRAEGVEIVLSLLDRDEVSELGLQREAGLCREQGMTFLSFPIPDRGVPDSLRETIVLARRLAKEITEGRTIAIHCRAGIGRSALMAACALVCLGAGPEKALQTIGEARGVSVPDTEGQCLWVSAFQEATATAR